MQLLEVKNDIAKIMYNPTENHLLPADFLLIEDTSQKLISQIIDIETTENSNNNYALLKLSLIIDPNDSLLYYNGYIPSKDSKIIYISPDEIIELLKEEENIYLGMLANHSDCFVKQSINILNDKIYIQSDREDKVFIAVSNLISELNNINKNVILIDFDGKYSLFNNANYLYVSENFKLPLTIEAFNTILKYDTLDCPLEDKALIQSIVIELREYLNTLEDKFIPFTMFKNVVSEEFLANPVSGLMLLRNKLWLYAQDSIFAESKNQFDIINNLLDQKNLLIIDASKIESKWFNFIIQTVLNLINKPSYLIFSLNDVETDKRTIMSFYNKKNVIPIVSTTYDSKYSQYLKSICKNQLLFKPAKFSQDEDYSILLNKINTNEMLLCGETTLYLVLLLELASFTPTIKEDIIENEIKKDVDKFLSSSKSIIPQDGVVKELKHTDNSEKKTEISDDEIIEDDGLTDSDLDFLDETYEKDLESYVPQIVEEVQPNVNYELFNPVLENNQENNSEDCRKKFPDNESEQNSHTTALESVNSDDEPKIKNDIELNNQNNEDQIIEIEQNEKIIEIENEISSNNEEIVDIVENTDIPEKPELAELKQPDLTIKINDSESSTNDSLQNITEEKSENDLEPVIQNNENTSDTVKINLEENDSAETVKEESDEKNIQVIQKNKNEYLNEKDEHLNGDEKSAKKSNIELGENSTEGKANKIDSLSEKKEDISNADKIMNEIEDDEEIQDITENKKQETIEEEELTSNSEYSEESDSDDLDILYKNKVNEVTILDEVIGNIKNKYEDESNNATDKTEENESTIETNNTKSPKEDDESKWSKPPKINESIHSKKPKHIPIYETDSAENLYENIPFKIGDRVYHPKHGNGLIVGFANYSNKILFCQIEFENVGRRILDPRISGIEKVS